MPRFYFITILEWNSSNLDFDSPNSDFWWYFLYWKTLLCYINVLKVFTELVRVLHDILEIPIVNSLLFCAQSYRERESNEMGV